MGYRGEDSARDRAAWGTQSPRQSSSGQWPVSDESWSSGSRGHEARGYEENPTEHAGYDGNRHAGGSGYAADDNYAGYDGYDPGRDYGADGYSGADYNGTGYNGTDRNGTDYHGAGYNNGAGYNTADYGSGGYSGADYSGPDYDSSGYDASSTGGYRTDRQGSGGYPAVSGRDTGGYDTYRNDGRASADYNGAGHDGAGHNDGGYDGTGPSSAGYNTGGYSTGGDSADRSSGGYPAVNDRNSGSYPAPTAYDSPANRSGGYPTLGGPSGGYPTQGGRSGGYPAITSGQADNIPDAYHDGNDWYANAQATHGAGFADTSTQIAIRDPIRGYPPEAARPESGVARTGQQQRYDESEYVSYPGYDGVDDGGYGTRRGYDDYDNYAPAGQVEYATRLDQPVVDYDSPRGYGQALQGDDFDGGVYQDDPMGGPGGRPPGGTGPRKPPRGAGPKRGGGKVGGTKIMVAAVALILVGAAGFGGYKFLTKPKAAGNTADLGKPLPSAPASASAATAQCVQQFGPFCHIENRQLDPAPLTIDEVYPAAFFSETAKTQFVRSGTAEDKDCSKAVIGANITKQLKTGQCNQVLRATYVSGDGKVMGTIGVINLSTTNQAHYAGKIVGKADFIMPLAGTKGPTAKLGNGTGVVEAQYKGHYLILTWAEFVNQQTPSTPALTNQLEGFENALVAGTANIVLSQRMVNGDGAAASTSPSASASASKGKSASASPSAS